MNLFLLAPQGVAMPGVLPDQPDNYEELIAEIQRFRGRVYVQDEAIPPSALDKQGRHYSKLDYNSYHVVARNAYGDISGVMRIPVYVNGTAVWFFHLYHTLERMNPEQKCRYSQAIQHFIDQSANDYPFIVEPGGWAADRKLCDRLTGTTLAASTYALSQLLGGCIGISTVTVKHNAADLLKMMGGVNAFAGTPNARFYDPFHRCELEIIYFHSDKFNPRFADMVEMLKQQWQVSEQRVLAKAA